MCIYSFGIPDDPSIIYNMSKHLSEYSNNTATKWWRDPGMRMGRSQYKSIRLTPQVSFTWEFYTVRYTLSATMDLY